MVRHCAVYIILYYTNSIDTAIIDLGMFSIKRAQAVGNRKLKATKGVLVLYL